MRWMRGNTLGFGHCKAHCKQLVICLLQREAVNYKCSFAEWRVIGEECRVLKCLM